MSLRKSLGLYRAVALMALLVAALLAAAGASSAGAAVSGELGTAWGEQGTGPGELSTPVILGVDSTDGSVFVGGYTAGGVVGGGSMRLQKFSGTGTIEAETTLPNSAISERAFEGIVVDSSAHLFYLLQYAPGADTSNGKPAAQQIVVFSTEPGENPLTHKKELEPPTSGPTTLPVPVPTATEAIDNPQEMVFDPHDDALEIMGENRAGQFILQRVGTDGSLGGRYTETSNAAGLNSATFASAGGNVERTAAIAVGPTGETFIVTTAPGSGEEIIGFKLAAGFNGTPSELAGLRDQSTPENPQIYHVLLEGFAAFGNQIAISPDGETLYWKTGAVNPETPGNETIWGYSLADEHVNHIYGLGAATCTVENSGSALATIGQDLVVLDEGSLAEEFSPYGVRVMKFGPGGSSCPEPAAELKLIRAGSPASTVPVNTPVTLDGSGSELGTYVAAPLSPLGATFKIEGPGGTVEEEVTATDLSALKLTHQFTQVGTYTIRMELKLSSSGVRAGEPLPKEGILAALPRTITVGPASGGAEFPLTVTKTGTGTGTVSSSPPGIDCGTGCSAEFAEATAVTLTATPASGSTFAGWTGAGCAGTGTCEVTMSAAKAVEAKFEPSGTPAEFTLSVSKSGAGSGTVTSSPAGISCGSGCSAKFAENQSVTLTATPASGSSFAGWSGACTGLGSCQVTMSAAKSVSAKFEPASGPAVFTLTVGKAGTGSGTVTSAPAGIDCGGACSGNYQEGTTVTLTASAASGSAFAGWGGACSGTGTCVVALSSAKSVTATFNANPVSSPPPPTEIHPTPIPKPKPKPLKCKKGFKKGKVHGVAKCVKGQKQPAKHHKKSKNHRKK